MLRVEAAVLRSERSPKLSQTEPSSKAGRGILLSALVAGLVKANAVAQKGGIASASDAWCQNRAAAIEKGYK